MDKGIISEREGRRDEMVVVLSQAQRSARPAPVRRRRAATQALALLARHGREAPPPPSLHHSALFVGRSTRQASTVRRVEVMSVI